MITINALKIRTKLGSILDNVVLGEHYIVERLGKPTAVIIPYTKFNIEKHEEEIRRRRMEQAAKKMDKWREKHSKKYSGEDSVTIIRRMRKERTKHLLNVIEGR